MNNSKPPAKCSRTTYPPTSEGDFYLSDSDGCLSCEGGNAWLLPVVLLIAAMIGGLVAFVIFSNQQQRIMMFYEQNIDRLNEHIERLTAAVSLMQIISILNSTHTSIGGSEVPSPYLEFMQWFSFLTLDVVTIVPFDCMWEDQLYVWRRCLRRPHCFKIKTKLNDHAAWLLPLPTHRQPPTPPISNTASLHHPTPVTILISSSCRLWCPSSFSSAPSCSRGRTS